jgi:hypothetical protein
MKGKFQSGYLGDKNIRRYEQRYQNDIRDIIGIIHSDDFYAGPAVLSRLPMFDSNPEVKALYGIQVY